MKKFLSSFLLLKGLDFREFEKGKTKQCSECVTGAGCLWDFPGKYTGVDSHFLLQIFPTQGSNPRLLSLLDYRQILHHLSHQDTMYRCFSLPAQGISR